MRKTASSLNQTKAPTRSDVTAETLRDLLHYEVVTGRFYRRTDGVEVKGWCGGAKKQYLIIDLFRKKYRAHRLAYLWVEGVWPEGDVDHINRMPDCNGWHNLRDTTRSENMRNTQAPSSNKSGVKGVCKCSKGTKWRAYLMVNYKQHTVGRFNTVEEASAALRLARENLHGEFAKH